LRFFALWGGGSCRERGRGQQPKSDSTFHQKPPSF
jgi:hypothetical protein